MDIQEKKAVIVDYLQERLRLYNHRMDEWFKELRNNPGPVRQGELLNAINHYQPVINELERLIRDDLS